MTDQPVNEPTARELNDKANQEALLAFVMLVGDMMGTMSGPKGPLKLYVGECERVLAHWGDKERMAPPIWRLEGLARMDIERNRFYSPQWHIAKAMRWVATTLAEVLLDRERLRLGAALDKAHDEIAEQLCELDVPT